jgi:hypothetical protein
MYKSAYLEFPWPRPIDVCLSNSMGSEGATDHLKPEVEGDELLI